ncbi:hypothetical protein MA16_Dca010958 [Dendrobium catenatum]|uniref:Conserved oligomeric Golgi complex subunit 6 n=1 Tax=Dendrobium catenatum TaxID=906689 RepID=A0A2I0WVN7_9ASPA|nr:hypothetical protein MA16_Dca010958 [Dendrobium catenatum]
MATVSLAPGLSRKLKKVLATRTDSPDLLDSLGTLSTFYTDNTPQARRNLRSSIELRSLSINHHFLSASLPAQQVLYSFLLLTKPQILLWFLPYIIRNPLHAIQALDKVEEEINALAECCDQIAKALSSCSASTGDIIRTTERLKQELDVTTQRQEIISALRDEELNDNFFKALQHVQEIHANCKILLRTHHQRAGLELMDMMSVYQEVLVVRKLSKHPSPSPKALTFARGPHLRQRPSSLPEALTDPNLLPTMVLPTSITYYGHFDIHHQTTVTQTPVSYRLRSSRPPSPTMTTPTSITRQRSLRPRSPTDYGPPDLRRLLWSF